MCPIHLVESCGILLNVKIYLCKPKFSTILAVIAKTINGKSPKWLYSLRLNRLNCMVGIILQIA